jgi:hypothetical protein
MHIDSRGDIGRIFYGQTDRGQGALAPSLVGLIRVGGQEVVIHDPNTVDAVSADLITEGREFRGICALSFATVVTTPRANGPSTVEGIICARLRLSLAGGPGPSQHARQNPDEVHAGEAGDALSETGFPALSLLPSLTMN